MTTLDGILARKGQSTSAVTRRYLERDSGIVYPHGNVGMRETGRSLSAVGAGDLREAVPST